MRGHSIRSKQLRSFRKKCIFREGIWITFTCLIIATFLICYRWGYETIIQEEKALSFLRFFYPEQGSLRNLFILTVFLILLIIGCGVFFQMYRKHNKLYHQKYLDLLFEECRLNEVYYFFRKKTTDQDLFREVEKIASFDHMEKVYSLTDANSLTSLEYVQVRYEAEKVKRDGVLLIARLSKAFDGFLQIRTKGEPVWSTYQGKSIHRFGFSSRTYLKNFMVFSSLGSGTYCFEKEEVSRVIGALLHFVNCDLTLTSYGNTLMIVFEGFRFNLTQDLYARIKTDDFEQKVEALVTLHARVMDVLMLMMNLKV